MPTVKQLIKSLSACPPDAEIEILVKQHNKVYPVAYCKPIGQYNENDYALPFDEKKARMTIYLPEKMHTTIRKTN